MLVLLPRRLLQSTLGPLELFRSVLASGGIVARPVDTQQSPDHKGTSDEDKGEDDSVLRLTAEDAWTFPVVCTFNCTLRVCRENNHGP